jgi:hypothetical protein
MKRSRHVTTLHTRKVVARKRQAIGTDVGTTEPGTGGEEDYADFFGTTHGVGFADSAEVTVVAGNDGNGATGFGAEGVGIVLEKIPPGKAVGKVGGLIEHAVGLIGSRERQAYATDLIPRDIVVGEEALHPIKPTRDNGFSAGG